MSKLERMNVELEALRNLRFVSLGIKASAIKYLEKEIYAEQLNCVSEGAVANVQRVS